VTSKLPEHDPEQRSVPTPDSTNPQHGPGPSGQTNRPGIISPLVPWPRLGLGLSLSLVLAGDVMMATVAWFAVEMIMR